ncbi:MAG: hypothetical protein FRX49_03167 [Trebouxia sp. A1-2]|nr:MAG: hypothetical protein FRX49_03167 [Trebouxia sp. A1-2]
MLAGKTACSSTPVVQTATKTVAQDRISLDDRGIRQADLAWHGQIWIIKISRGTSLSLQRKPTATLHLPGAWCNMYNPQGRASAPGHAQGPLLRTNWATVARKGLQG